MVVSLFAVVPCAQAANVTELAGMVGDFLQEGEQAVSCAAKLYMNVQSGNMQAAYLLLAECKNETKDVIAVAMKIAAQNGDLPAVSALSDLTKSTLQLYPFHGMALASVVGFLAGYLVAASN